MLALAVTGNIIHDWLRQLEQRGLNQAMTHSTLPARREEVVSIRSRQSSVLVQHLPFGSRCFGKYEREP